MLITNPVLKLAYDHDWYYPWNVPAKIKDSHYYQAAVKEGWHEWIETPLDFEAMKAGYIYDVSRDVKGKPCYWFEGAWQLGDGTIIPVEDEAEYIGHVGRGDHFMRFCETFLKHTKAPLEGQPYRSIHWMRKASQTLFGWVNRNTRYRRYNNFYCAISKKNGKLLSNDTPVPVPEGWKNHGDLKVGDKLFDARGEVCHVIAVHPKDYANYEVHFSNGEKIKCNGEHLWVIDDEGEYKNAKTDVLYSAVRYGLDVKLAYSDVTITWVSNLKEPVEGNCITVSSEDGTYLCGKTMLPTHNSALMSTIALYMLVADGTPKAQVYSCACDRNQARIIYDEAMHMIKSSEVLEDMVTVVESRSRLVHQSSGSFYQVLSADAHRNDGIDSSCTLIDEIHRHPNRKLYSVMLRAGQARPEPLMATITTYGPSLADGSIWAEVHNEAKAQLEGLRPNSWRNLVMVASAEPITATTTEAVPAGCTRVPVSRLIQPVEKQVVTFDIADFAGDGIGDKKQVEVEIVEEAKRFQDYITIKPLDFELPAFSESQVNNDWRSNHAIYRANPSVGIVFEADRLREQIEQSRTPEREAETRQLNLNIVSGSGRRFISTAAWQACGKLLVQPKKLLGRSGYAGLDLSFKNDLTAFSLSIPSWDAGQSIEFVENPRIDLLTWAWVPRASIELREEDEQFPYSFYAKQDYFLDKGAVRFCEGSVIDYTQVAEDIIEICSHFGVLGIAYDPNYANFCIPMLEAAGFVCIQHRQGAVSMSPPCKRFVECAYNGILAHGNNPVLDRAVEGAQLHPPDKAGNTYLSKGSSHTRIDALVANVMSVGFCCDPPEGASMAYTDSSTGMWG